MNDKDQSSEVVPKQAGGGQLDADVPVVVAVSQIVPGRHMAIANTIIAGLHAFAAMIEGFGRAQKGRRSEVANFQAIPDDALEVVARGLEFSPVFAQAAQLTPEEVRDAIEFTDAFSGVKYEFELFVLALADTIAEKRGVTGERCTRAVRIGSELTLKGEPQSTVLHLRQMVDLFRQRRRKAPQIERDVKKAVTTAKRRAAPVVIDVSSSQPAVEPATVQFKAGRDLES